MCKFDLDQSECKSSQVNASARKPWPNGVASRPKFSTCVYLRLRLSRALLRCLYCWKAEVLLFETIGQCSDVIKSKMAAHGKFKRRNLFSLLLLLLLLLLLNVTFPLSSKICNVAIICSNIASTRANSRGSL